MREILSEIELLEFIEDELSPAQMAAVRERLTREPELLARLERMRDDRATLASEAEPTLRFDLVSELEPLLAKPMLLGASTVTQVRPGVYRARHRRSFTRRWRSLAMAATFLMVTGTAVLWGVIELGSRSGGDQNLAFNDDAGGLDPSSNASGPVAVQAPTAVQGTIHHWLPSRDAIVLADAARVIPEPSGNVATIATVTLRNGVEAMEAPVILVVRVESQPALLDSLATLMNDPSVAGGENRTLDGALVRNFTFQEVEAAWREMVASSGLPHQQELIASMDGASSFHSLNSQQRAAVHEVARHTTANLGEHLAGDRAWAATADQQLRFVEQGAAHAVSLPAREVIALLESLSTEFRESIWLAVGDSEGERAEAAGADPLASWRAWRDAIGCIRAAVQSRPSAAIVIPLAAR